MRLKLNYEKVKTYILMLVITFVVPFTCLCCLYVKGLCANSDIYNYPLPFGGGGYGYGGQLTSEVVYEIVSQSLALYPDADFILVPQLYNENECSVIIGRFGSITFTGNYDNLYYTSSIKFNMGSSSPSARHFNLTTMTLSSITYGRNNSYTCNVSNYVLPDVTQDVVDVAYLQKGVYIPNYPLYINPNSNGAIWKPYFVPFDSDDGGGGSGGTISVNGHSVGGGTISGGDGSSGGADGSFDFDFDFDLDIPDYRSQLDDIGGSVDSIGENLDDIGGVVGDIFDGIGSLNTKADTQTTWLQRIYAKLVDGTDGDESWLKKIYEALVDFFQGFEIPSETDVQNELANSKMLGGIIRISNSSKQFVSSINADDIEVPSASDMDFDYPFHWQVYDFTSGNFVDKVTIVHIIFSWYESIRDKVMLVLSVFMISGFVVYIWKQVPNFINGVSGGASAGQSIADFNVNHKGVKQK